MTELVFCKTTELDLEAILSMEADQENSSFISKNTRAEHLELIENEHFEHLLLKSPSNAILGFVLLAGLNNVNTGIELRRIVIKEKGQGLGRQAIIQLKEYCFVERGCHRLWLDVVESNSRARHLYQSEGFREEGKLRESILIGDQYKDLIIMAILKGEYENSLVQKTSDSF